MNCLFNNIMLLVDCSPVDNAIIQIIEKIASCGNAVVTLTHVIHSHTIDQDTALKDKADKCMSDYLTLFEKKSVKTNILLLSGEPEVELVKEIDTGKYDLIALATHGHKMLSDILFGSISDHLKHTVSVPIIMIRGNP